MKQVVLELFQQKKRLVLAAGGLLLLNILLYSLMSGYLERRVTAARNAWNDLRLKVAAAGKADVGTIYRRGTEDLTKLSVRIPLKRQFPRVLGDLLDAAAANNLSIGAVSYKPQAVKGQDLLAYGVSMTVGGSYAALKSYLADLQKNSEMLVIDGINLSNSDLYEENVVMDLKMTIYLQGKEGG